MKTIKFHLPLLALFALTGNIFAQTGVSATATASGTIVTPIAITKTVDLDFGNAAVNSNAGTVVLAATDGSRSVTGGCTLPAVTGTVARAEFTITGTANYTYSITLPTGATTVTSGANSMTVDTWTSNPTPTGTLDGSGEQTLYIGGTLNVGASQAAGTYTSATPFTITVDYN